MSARQDPKRAVRAMAAAAVTVALLAGCGKKQSPPAQPAQPQVGTPQSKDTGAAADRDKNNVFAPLENDLQRARDVQKTVDQQAQRLKQEIDKQTGGDGSQ